MFTPMFRKVSFRILLCCAGLSFWIGCAQQGSPTGGPRDETPPRVVESEPPNYSTRFTANKILITFDEFIVIENVNQELIVSPPMEEKPEVKLRKKTLVIEFEEQLKENTTYTFNFGNAITDLHEGNPLVNFEYVFATGDVLDSMSVKGIIRYSKDLSFPEDPVSIMLYRNLGDSVPLTEIPLYVGRSEDSGIFSINNLSPDTYKVFALKDGNNNFLFDLPTEEIAFLDTSLTVSAELSRSLLAAAGLLDTLALGDTLVPVSDSLTMASDTLVAETDSIIDTGPDLNAIYIDLYLFAEETDIQYIADYTREDRRRIELMFARPLTDSFRYGFLTPGLEQPVERIEHFSQGRDSLTLWMTDSMDFRLDTLVMQVNYMVKDTSGVEFLKTDTLNFTYRETRRSRQRGEREASPSERLTVSTLRNNGILELNRDLAITLDLPLKEFHDSLISFFRLEDSLEIPVPLATLKDTTSLYRGWIRSDWQSDTRYRLILYPGAVSSIYPVQHDTIDMQFSTRDVEYYGQILLNLEGVQGPSIVQLMIEDQLISQVTTSSSGRIAFPLLAPKEYRIRVIHDKNKNGKWDTGKYLEGRQPEPVEFLKGSVTVRSKWDHDVTMRLER